MDSAPSLLALLGRGPGIAVLPGAARRFSPPSKKKKKKKSEENEAVEKNFGMGFPVFGKNVKSIMMSPPVVLQMGDGACWAHSQPVLKKLVCDTPTPWFPFVVVKPNKGP